MDLPSKSVFDAILDKGVTELHHANSVLTSCHFLRNGALLSRGTVNRRRIFQTPQKSDEDDRRFNVWFDVFTDSVDIHERASNANVYGPVLFVLDIEELRKSWTGRLWITKLNPSKWEDVPDDDRWFRSIKEIKNDFNYGTFNQMIVFRHCGGELPFRSALKEIILDDPEIQSRKTNIDFYSMAFGALQLAAWNLDITIKKRGCLHGCKCLQTYARDSKKTLEMFSPKPQKGAQ